MPYQHVLPRIVKEALMVYTGEGARSYAFPAFDDEHQTYTVTLVDFWESHFRPNVMAMVRIVGDQIIIDEEARPRLLLETLLAQGIPRDKIVLAYADDPYPASAIPAVVEMS